MATSPIAHTITHHCEPSRSRHRLSHNLASSAPLRTIQRHFPQNQSAPCWSSRTTTLAYYHTTFNTIPLYSALISAAIHHNSAKFSIISRQLRPFFVLLHNSTQFHPHLPAPFSIIQHHSTSSLAISHHSTPWSRILHLQLLYTPFRSLLHHYSQFCTIPHYSAPPTIFRIIPHHLAPFRVILHHAAPFSAISHDSAPSRTILHNCTPNHGLSWNWRTGNWLSGKCRDAETWNFSDGSLVVKLTRRSRSCWFESHQRRKLFSFVPGFLSPSGKMSTGIRWPGCVYNISTWLAQPGEELI